LRQAEAAATRGETTVDHNTCKAHGAPATAAATRKATAAKLAAVQSEAEAEAAEGPLPEPAGTPEETLRRLVEAWRGSSGIRSGWTGLVKDRSQGGVVPAASPGRAGGPWWLRATRDALRACQATLAVEDHPEDDAAVAARDAARGAHERLLRRVLRDHTRRAPQRRLGRLLEAGDKFRAALAAASAEARAYGVGLTAACMLAEVSVEAETLSAWLVAAAQLQAELDDLVAHGGARPDLTALDRLTAAWRAALLDAARLDTDVRLERVKLEAQQRSAAPSAALEAAQAAHGAARRGLQARDRALNAERCRVAAVAAAHWPELFCRREDLRLERDDIAAAGGLLVPTRELAHYEVVGLLSDGSSRHVVRRARFGGRECVLKEYRLTANPKTRRRLLREVRLLQSLSGHPNVAKLDCIFEEPPKQGQRLAYLQMPYYPGGDLASWLARTQPSEADRVVTLSQVAQALQYMHGSGHWHADVKLENVLMDAAGVPHLCDFELSRGELAGTATTTKMGGTEDYLSPEGPTTPAADMYAFGVCVLKSFLRPGEYERKLAGGFSLPSGCAGSLRDLLDALLRPDPAKRLTAAGALLHPFLNPAVATDAARRREAAAHATEAAGIAHVERAQALSHDRIVAEEAQLGEKQAQARRVRRRADAELARKRAAQQQHEALARRKLEQREEELHESVRQRERAMRQLRHELRTKEQRLAREKASVASSKGDVEATRRRLKSDERAVQGKRDALRKEQRGVEKEKAELGRRKAERLHFPRYWKREGADRDGFALFPLTEARNAAVWRVLARCLHTPRPEWMGSGTDTEEPWPANSRSKLVLSRAWRLESPNLWRRYCVAQETVRSQIALLRRQRKLVPVLSTMLDRTTRALPGTRRTDVNEAYLLHGTGPLVVESILSGGTNMRYSKVAAFGNGIYFAEDPAKNDQYVTNDSRFGAHPALHKRLYSTHSPAHPNERVYYLILCRVTAGALVRTRDGRTQLDGQGSPSVFCRAGPRELAQISGVTPPVHHHALLVETGGRVARFREVVVFHDEYIYPEYILAYRRRR
jgi:hypothetical protein